MNLLQWLARRMGPWRLFSLALLLAALCSVASGLAGVIRELDDRLALMAAATALLLGWGLATTSLPGWAAVRRMLRRRCGPLRRFGGSTRRTREYGPWPVVWVRMSRYVSTLGQAECAESEMSWSRRHRWPVFRS